MDYGNYLNQGRTPPVYSVFDRFFLGWLTPEQKSATANLTLNPIYQGTTPPSNTINQTFLLSGSTHNLIGNNPSPNEFFMLEYRQKTGWDTYLPAEGMCIWHIDYNQTDWNDNVLNNYTGPNQTLASHMRVYLQPLSGSSITPGTAFTTGSFIPTTWSGTDINRAITNIIKTADNITFNFMPSKMSIAGTFTDFSTTLGAPSSFQNIDVSAQNLTGNMNISFQNNINFEAKLSTDVNWSKSLIISPVTGNIFATIQVRFNPAGTGTLSDQLNISTQGITTVGFNLNGISTIGPNSPVIFVGKIDNAIAFPTTKVGITNTKTINVKTTDLVNNIILTISGANAGMFAVSTNTITKDAANGTDGNNIAITYLPTSVGNHTATLTISCGGLPDKIYTLNGTGY
jgi:hypothetical protein